MGASQAIINFFDEDFTNVSLNSFKMTKLCEKFYIFFKLELFNVSKESFYNFINNVKLNYHLNSYHNFSHALDTCNTLVYLLSNTSLAFSDIDKFSLFIAMLCHDIKHFGKTNSFVVRYDKEFTKIYSDVSPIENFHCEKALEIIKETNFLKNFTDEEQQYILNIVVKIILSTDPEMTKKYLEEFNTNFINCEKNISVETKKMCQLKLFAKCSDIGSSIKNFNVHKKWSNLLLEEFFIQGNDIKSNNGHCDSLFDSNKQNEIPKNQVFFFDNYAIPLYVKILPYLNSDNVMIHLNRNKNIWQSQFV